MSTWSAWEWDLAQLKPLPAFGHPEKVGTSTWQGSQCDRPWTSSPRRGCRFAVSRMVLRAGGGDPPGGSVDDFCGGLQPGAQ